MRKIAGQVTKVQSGSGYTWEYWFGVRKGKRLYLACPYDSLNCWEFETLKDTLAFIASR